MIIFVLGCDQQIVIDSFGPKLLTSEGYPNDYTIPKDTKCTYTFSITGGVTITFDSGNKLGDGSNASLKVIHRQMCNRCNWIELNASFSNFLTILVFCRSINFVT